MSNGVVRVSFDRMYDLYFRVRNKKMDHLAYRIDFMEWVKAGVAYNARGIETSTRKISYFGDLYRKLTSLSDYSEIVGELQEAVKRYYEDLFLLYKDHLYSVQYADRNGARGLASIPLHPELLLIPAFTEVPRMYDVFQPKVVTLASYEIQHEKEFREELPFASVPTDCILYKCMGLFYDNSFKSDGNIFLLGVNEC